MEIPFDSFTVLNKNNESLIFGFDKKLELEIHETTQLSQVDQFIHENQGQFIFCALNYNLKNHFLGLQSTKIDPLHFPLIHLWISDTVVELKEEKTITIQGYCDEHKKAFINEFLSSSTNKNGTDKISLKARTPKKRYLDFVQKIKDHIQLGDIYEVNYCQEFYAENTSVSNPLHLYKTLDSQIKAPFSSFINNSSNNIYCFSPERFIKKKERTYFQRTY